jgi:hypothetical protein
MDLPRAIRLVNNPEGFEYIAANRGEYQGNDKCSEA